MNEDENGFVCGEEMKRQVLYKVMYGEQVFCSIFENRKNTNVSGLGNISNFFQKFKLETILFVGPMVFGLKQILKMKL